MRTPAPACYFIVASISGTKVTVIAHSEQGAREQAMTTLYGRAPQVIGKPPVTIGHPFWGGLGLTILATEVYSPETQLPAPEPPRIKPKPTHKKGVNYA